MVKLTGIFFKILVMKEPNKKRETVEMKEKRGMKQRNDQNLEEIRKKVKETKKISNLKR
jgi:hypothetical protein